MRKRISKSAVLTILFFIQTVFVIRSLFKSNVQEVVKTNNGQKEYYNLRVACIILTQIKNHKTRVRAITDTWGRKCKFLIYVTNSTIHLDDQQVFDTEKVDSYSTIWGKVKNALKHTYTKYHNEVDWFIKADDDSYIILENVQHFIESKKIKPSDPTWFGSEYRLFSKHGYMAGGGYIMSRESVRRFVEIGLNRTSNEGCKALDDGGAEDAEMGICMSFLGVIPTDNRDKYGRTRNFPFNIHSVVNPGMPSSEFWYWKNIKYPQVFGHPGCCSDTSSIFHYVTPSDMYKYEYLLYSAKIYGEKYGERPPPPPESLAINMNIDWKKIRGI